jgi:NTE family protein
MEEHRIPIDAVAGTSMGGLVGGMFASGYSATDLQAFVGELDWNVLLETGTEYRDLNFRRKEDVQSYPASFELGLRDGHLQFPAGLSSGQQIQLLFERIGLPYSDVASFDDLPTPFRCVAADLLSGDKVVLREGSLSQALRATMSLPAVFTPVPYNGMLLVDGGLVDNLPADVVRDMNVDVVIAVDLGIARLAPTEPLTLVDVLSRSMDIMIRHSAVESLRDAQIVIQPSVLDFKTLEFDQASEVIERGYQAAQAMSAELEKYAVGESEWQAYLAARSSKTRSGDFTPQFIEVSGGLPRDNRSVAKQLSDLKGKPFDRQRAERDLTRITGFGLYDSAGYQRVHKDGKEGLAVQLNRKNYGPPFVRPLLILDSGQSGNASFTIAARISTMNFPAANSELRTDLSFGRLLYAGSEYYQFIGRRGFFVAPRGFASREKQILTNNGQTLVEYNVRRAGGGFDIGYNFGRFSELRTGIEVDHLNAQVQIGFPILPNARGPEQIFTTRWRFNALNSGTVPTRGIFIDSQLNWQFQSPNLYVGTTDMGRGDRFGQAWTRLIYAHPFADKWTGLFRAIGGGTFGGEVQPFSQFRLGGPLRIGAIEIGELRGANVAFASAAVLRKFYDSPTSMLSRVYGVVAYEGGDAFNSRLNWFHSGTAGVMAETSLGILTGGFSYGEGGRSGFFFAVGRIFDVGVRNSSQLR